MGKFRDGSMPVTGEAVTLVLSAIDRIKDILSELDKNEREPVGTDADLIDALEGMVLKGAAPNTGAQTAGTTVHQVLERPLRPGEVSLDELERMFRETPGPAPTKSASTAPAPAQSAPFKVESEDEERAEAKAAHQSIRVNLDTLEYLMTMVSELVLTRNQLLDIMRRHVDSDFKAPLQRLSNVTAELQEGVMKTRMQPIGTAWQKLPRIVRDLSAELGKDIELEMHGADTELDRQVLERIKDPLTHMVRNSADHGLEFAGRSYCRGQAREGHDSPCCLPPGRPHHH